MVWTMKYISSAGKHIIFLRTENTAIFYILENYYKADSSGKVEQTKEMILAAVKRICSKGRFDYDKFKADLLSLKE